MKPDALLLILLAAWWVLNLIQAALTGLADDEAYYWYFSQRLDWGYFDHPPLVALLVWFSSWCPGALGIRFCCTLLQPLYLLVFWHVIRPPQPSHRDVLLYALLCFAMPVLQLYGFLAVPDAPLLFTVALFLWCFKRFSERGGTVDALLLGASVALMGYSKYHGALVVALAVLANPRLLRQWRLWLAGAFCLLLYAPHLLWQASHDWPTVRYHLMERNRAYDVHFTLEYLLNLVLIFNPLFVWHYLRGCGKALRSWRSLSAYQRSMVAIGLGFPVFFLFSTLRGHTQPQWLLPAVFPMLALLFSQARNSARYLRGVAIVCAVLFIVVRVLAMTNPMHLKGEVWDNEASYARLAEVADGRPVVFMHHYAQAAKYAYYTGQPVDCAPYYFRRRSQWQYDTVDRQFAHRSVVIGNFTNGQAERVELPNGTTFHYTILDDYLPLRELSVAPVGRMDIQVAVADDSIGMFDLPLAIVNPYPFDVYGTEEHPLELTMYFRVSDRSFPTTFCVLGDTLRASDTTLVHASLRLPSLPEGNSSCGFGLGYPRLMPSDNAPLHRINVSRTPTAIRVSE